MPRVPALPATALAPEIARVYERFTSAGKFADQAAVLAHVPPALDHLYRMLMELNARQVTPRRYIEIGIVVASKLNACSYCVANHAPVLAIEGLSPQAISHLPQADHPEFDAADRSVIEYANLVTRSAGMIRDRVFEALHRHFTDAQIVELTLRIALAGFFNRFNDALQIDDARSASPAGPAFPSLQQELPQ